MVSIVLMAEFCMLLLPSFLKYIRNPPPPHPTLVAFIAYIQEDIFCCQCFNILASIISIATY
jgi:hypothetical protein